MNKRELETLKNLIKFTRSFIERPTSKFLFNQAIETIKDAELIFVYYQYMSKMAKKVKRKIPIIYGTKT